MSHTTGLGVAPEVSAFVARVRQHLGDLTDEECEELVGGLEADLCDLVADGGSLAGLDPATYAGELRTAAGLELKRRHRRLDRRALTPARLAERLDVGRAAWDRLVEAHPWSASAWELTRALRPVWWALRAWIAVELLDKVTGPYEYLTVVPSLGNQLIGTLVLLVALAVSALVGLRRLGPLQPEAPSPVERLVLLTLNCFAVLMLLQVLSSFPNAWDSHQLASASYSEGGSPPPEPGLMTGGHYVRNVFAFDAAGRPLRGVQLYDAKGRPLAVSADPFLGSYRADGARVQTFPWLNGGQPLWNVFPLPVREQRGPARPRDVWTSGRPPALPTAPLAVVPPATLPQANPSTPAPSATPSTRPAPTPSAGRPSRTPTGRTTTKPTQRPSPKSGNSEKPGRR